MRHSCAYWAEQKIVRLNFNAAESLKAKKYNFRSIFINHGSLLAFFDRFPLFQIDFDRVIKHYYLRILYEIFQQDF